MREDFYAEYYEIEGVHWWFSGRWTIFLDLIRREMGSRSNIRALDVGCGTGTMLGHLETLGPAVGVDYSREAVRFCRERGRNRVILAKADALPFADQSFDVVCALDLLEHVSDDVLVLRELGRVCRGRGSALISVPAFRLLWGRQDEISHHIRRYTGRQLAARTRAAGLRLTHLSYFNTLLFPIVAAVRIGRRLLPVNEEAELRSDFTMTRPGRLNDLLTRVFSLESHLIRACSLPFGVSLLAVGRPKGDGA